jgi:hypothetical protein
MSREEPIDGAPPFKSSSGMSRRTTRSTFSRFNSPSRTQSRPAAPIQSRVVMRRRVAWSQAAPPGSGRRQARKPAAVTRRAMAGCSGGARRLTGAKGKVGRLSYREISARLTMLVTPFNQQSVRAIIRGATLPVASTERHRLTNAEHKHPLPSPQQSWHRSLKRAAGNERFAICGANAAFRRVLCSS